MNSPPQETRRAIPRIIHQIWLGPPMPEQVRDWIDGWRAMYGDWEHRLWTEQNLPALVNQVWFDATDIPAQKADIARYEIVHRFGGLYVDADYECLGGIDGVLAGREHLLIDGADSHLLHNGFFAAAPGSPLLARAIELIPQRMRERPGVVGQTGPRLFAEAAREVGLSWQPARILDGIAHHHAMGSWLGRRFRP